MSRRFGKSDLALKTPMESFDGRFFQQKIFFQRNRFHLWMSNGFSYKSNILYLNLKYGIIKNRKFNTYPSSVGFVSNERKRTPMAHFTFLHDVWSLEMGKMDLLGGVGLGLNIGIQIAFSL